jgi:predicted PurR-regulated permease PerM
MFFWNSKKERTTKVEVTISNNTVLRVVTLVILSVIFLAALRQASSALTLIFIAAFLAVALNAPVRWLAQKLPGKRRGNRALATGISFFMIVLVMGSFLASIVPPLVRQTDNFIGAVPGLVEDVQDENSSLGNFVRRYGLEDQADKLSGDLKGRLGNIGGAAVSTLGRVGSSVIATLTVLVMTFMMLVEGPVWMGLFRRLIPKDHREHTDELLNEMYKVVRGYINGQVLLAALAALLITVPLFALDISYPIALVVIVFICGLIPMVGHTIGAVIVSAVALFTSPWDALIILAYYILYQQIENYVVQPKVQANTTNMSPLLVFSSVVIGVNFGGLLGGLVAIPLAGCVRVLVMDYLRSRNYLTSKDLPAQEYAKPAK